MPTQELAHKPEDLTRLFVERANARDAAGIAALYEQDAVMAYPPGQITVGRNAIQALWEKILAGGPHFAQESPLPTLISGDIALTSTPPRDAAGARAKCAVDKPMAPGNGSSTSLSSTLWPGLSRDSWPTAATVMSLPEVIERQT